MIKSLFIFVLIFFVMAPFEVDAQSRSEKAVTAVVEQFRIAMIDADKEKLEAIIADSLSYGHSNGSIQNKAAFVQSVISGNPDFVTIEFKDQTISVSGKTAIVRHLFNATTINKGKPGEVHFKVLLVWKKMNGKWKLLARQSVKVE